jgi:hypothetical protein
MRFSLGITVGLVALLMLAANALAVKEYEPNDTRDTAFGPLEGGKPYTATFETENDADWYVFYVKTYSQMDFTASEITNCEFRSVPFRLLDKDGKFVNSFSAGAVNQVNHLRLTLNPGRYYFEVDNPNCENENDVYRFQIDPVTAITANRECGEAIVSKESVGPTLTKVAGELAKNSERLAKPSKEVKTDEGRLAALDKRWEKFLTQWKSAVRRLKHRHGIPGYVRRQKMRSLLASKRRTNLRLRSMKNSAKRDLATDQKVQAKVLEQRAGLQAVEAQAKSTQSQAEAQIVAHC